MFEDLSQTREEDPPLEIDVLRDQEWCQTMYQNMDDIGVLLMRLFRLEWKKG